MAHTMRDYAAFGWEFVKSPRRTGATAPSSLALAECMVDGLKLKEASSVCEFGPGTGAFTQTILDRLGDQTSFFAIEASPAMVTTWKERFPDRKIFQDSILNVRDCCKNHGVGCVDAIVCGLPWAAFDAEFQNAGLAATHDALKPGGQFVTFAYSFGAFLPAGMRFSQTIKKRFASVTKSKVVWGNLPPAFVYRCVK